MRIVRVLLIVALIISVLGNVILWAKYGNRRAVVTVNGAGISKRDIDDYLLQQAGPTVKATMVQRALIDQEAKAKGVLPTQADIDEEFNLQKETNFRFAQEVNANPWIGGEAKRRIAEQISKIRLLTKDVPVTDEELKEEYTSAAARYDIPNKAKVHLAIVTDPNKVNEIKQLMSSNPPVSPTVIMQQYRTVVAFLGDENKFTFVQPFGMPQNKEVFAMKPNAVKVFPPAEFAQMGAKAILIRMLEVIPGKKANLNDPKIKEKLRIQVAARRAKPWQEYFSTLWANSKVTTENPQDVKNMEMIYFPERAQAAK